MDLEAAVAPPDLRLAPRQRHVETLHLEDREALADGVDRAPLPEQRLQVGGGQAEHLDVEILGGVAEQRIADEAAHDQRAAAAGTHLFRDGAGERE